MPKPRRRKTFPPDEVAKVREWLTEHDEESPELLAAIDTGLRSFEEKGRTGYNPRRTRNEGSAMGWQVALTEQAEINLGAVVSGGRRRARSNFA